MFSIWDFAFFLLTKLDPLGLIFSFGWGGGGSGGRPPPPAIGANTAPWANGSELVKRKKSKSNPKMTKWQKIIKFKWSPYFWLGGLKNSSGRGVLLGCDVFQAERIIVIFTPIFKILMYFPSLYPS